MSDQTTPTTRPPFKVSGIATIKHLNVRKEGPEDEKILAVDVKLEIKDVDRRLCGYFDDALEAFLWRGNTNALIVRSAFLAPVMYLGEISNATCQIGLNHFSGCDVKKFQIQPRDGGVMTLTCSLSIYPSSADVSDIAKMVQDEERVVIEGPPDLFADDPVPAVAIESSDHLLDLTNFGDGPDPMYQQAMELVLKNSKPSISFVQRQLKIGYNRAARLIEDMEKAGLVSAMDKSGQRQVKAAKPVTCPYRGPNGETWSGRGLMPRWLGVLVQAGQDKESFRVPA
jgi:hypothetical protein